MPGSVRVPANIFNRSFSFRTIGSSTSPASQPHSLLPSSRYQLKLVSQLHGPVDQLQPDSWSPGLAVTRTTWGRAHPARLCSLVMGWARQGPVRRVIRAPPPPPGLTRRHATALTRAHSVSLSVPAFPSPLPPALGSPSRLSPPSVGPGSTAGVFFAPTLGAAARASRRRPARTADTGYLTRQRVRVAAGASAARGDRTRNQGVTRTRPAAGRRQSRPSFLSHVRVRVYSAGRSHRRGRPPWRPRRNGG